MLFVYEKMILSLTSGAVSEGYKKQFENLADLMVEKEMEKKGAIVVDANKEIEEIARSVVRAASKKLGKQVKVE